MVVGFITPLTGDKVNELVIKLTLSVDKLKLAAASSSTTTFVIVKLSNKLNP